MNTFPIKALRMFSAFCIFLLSGISISYCKSFPDSITIAAFEYPQIYQQTSDRGIALDIVYEAFLSADIKAGFEFFPVARMVKNVADGQVVCGIGGTVLFEKPEVTSEIYILDTIQYVLQVFLYDSRKYPKEITFTTLGDMKNYRIGVLFSSGINKYLEKEPTLLLEPNTSHEGSVKQLGLGRIDVWAIVDLTGMWYIQKNYPGEVVFFKYSKPFMRGDICAAFSKKLDHDSLYAKALKKGLAIIKMNGTYTKIMAKYYGGEVKINQYALTDDLRKKTTPKK
jgi:ABC-type amino acid transport substrate-binding protein